MQACGKIILFGDHAVVYGKPGIAIPVTNVHIKCSINHSDSFLIESDKELFKEEKERLHELIDFILFNLELKKKNLHISIKSTISVASGLGSSAALSISLIRAISDYFNLQLNKVKINDLAFECEKFFHGTPSGIDNTVITYEKPVYYQKGKMDFIKLKNPLKLVIANTGIKVDTKQVVSQVRERYGNYPKKYTEIFNEIENLVVKAKDYLESGMNIGELMTRNHNLLQELGVSCPELDKMVEKALETGAYGAKLAGSGKGGNMIALVDEKTQKNVVNALKEKTNEVIFTVVS